MFHGIYFSLGPDQAWLCHFIVKPTRTAYPLFTLNKHLRSCHHGQDWGVDKNGDATLRRISKKQVSRDNRCFVIAESRIDSACQNSINLIKKICLVIVHLLLFVLYIIRLYKFIFETKKSVLYRTYSWFAAIDDYYYISLFLLIHGRKSVLGLSGLPPVSLYIGKFSQIRTC